MPALKTTMDGVVSSARRTKGLFGRFEIADVEAKQFAFPAEGFDLPLGFAGLLVIAAIGEPDIASGSGQPEGGGLANPSAAADDQCDSRI